MIIPASRNGMNSDEGIEGEDKRRDVTADRTVVE